MTQYAPQTYEVTVKTGSGQELNKTTIQTQQPTAVYHFVGGQLVGKTDLQKRVDIPAEYLSQEEQQLVQQQYKKAIGSFTEREIVEKTQPYVQAFKPSQENNPFISAVKGAGASLVEGATSLVVSGGQFIRSGMETVGLREKEWAVKENVTTTYSGMESASRFENISYSIGYAAPFLVSFGSSVKQILQTEGINKGIAIGKLVGGTVGVNTALATGFEVVSAHVEQRPISAEKIKENVYKFTVASSQLQQITAPISNLAPIEKGIGRDIYEVGQGILSGGAGIQLIKAKEVTGQDVLIGGAVGGALVTASKIQNALGIETTHRYELIKQTTDTQATAKLKSPYTNEIAVERTGYVTDTKFGTKSFGIEVNEISGRVGIYVGDKSIGFGGGKGFIAERSEIVSQQFGKVLPINRLAAQETITALEVKAPEIAKEISQKIAAAEK